MIQSMVLLLLFVISEQAEACSFRDTGASCVTPTMGQNPESESAHCGCDSHNRICGGTNPPCEACTDYTLEACTELCRTSYVDLGRTVWAPMTNTCGSLSTSCVEQHAWSKGSCS
jgi:hypothetical protein